MPRPTESARWAIAADALRDPLVQPAREELGWVTLPDNLPADTGEVPAVQDMNEWMYIVGEFTKFIDTNEQGQVIIVAASDSSTAYKLAADFECLGNDDQLVLDQAISLAVTEGAKIVFLAPGTYVLGGTWNLNNVQWPLNIMGLENQTIITTSIANLATGISFNSSHALRGLTFSGANQSFALGIDVIGRDAFRISNVTFKTGSIVNPTSDAVGIRSNSAIPNIMSNVRFEESSVVTNNAGSYAACISQKDGLTATSKVNLVSIHPRAARNTAESGQYWDQSYTFRPENPTWTVQSASQDWQFNDTGWRDVTSDVPLSVSGVTLNRFLVKWEAGQAYIWFQFTVGASPSNVPITIPLPPDFLRWHPTVVRQNTENFTVSSGIGIPNDVSTSSGLTGGDQPQIFNWFYNPTNNSIRLKDDQGTIRNFPFLNNDVYTTVGHLVLPQLKMRDFVI